MSSLLSRNRAGRSVRRSSLALMPILFLLGVLAACGGNASNGSSSSAPSPANAGFSKASLNGKYVFRVNGTGANGSNFSVLGVFTADGAGNITAGQEDYNDQLQGVQEQVQFTGSYTVGTDGRGQAQFRFTNASSIPAVFDFVLSSTSAGRIIEFSSGGIASGRLQKQDSSALASVDGTWVLRVDGVALSGNSVVPVSRLGSLTVSGAAASASAVLDESFAGAFTQTISTTVVPGYTAGSGRGSLQLTLPSGGSSGGGSSTRLVFYVVNSSRLEVIGMDTAAPSSGSADAQSASIAVGGNYVFAISGYYIPGFGGIAEVGSFSLSGGTLSNGLEDASQFAVFAPSLSFTGSYSGGGSNGRQTGQFTSGSRTVHFVMWFSSPQNGVMMTTDSTLLETGLVQQQTATPSNSTLNGNYALRLSGIASAIVVEGQLQANGQGSFTGLEDWNAGGSLQTGASASGSYSIGSNGRGTGSIGGTPVVLYAVDANTIYLLSADGNVLVGGLEGQH